MPESSEMLTFAAWLTKQAHVLSVMPAAVTS